MTNVRLRVEYYGNTEKELMTWKEVNKIPLEGVASGLRLEGQEEVRSSGVEGWKVYFSERIQPHVQEEQERASACSETWVKECME